MNRKSAVRCIALFAFSMLLSPAFSGCIPRSLSPAMPKNQKQELSKIIGELNDLKPREEGRNPSVLINPEIVQKEGKITSEEACLSVVDFSAEVCREAQVMVKGFDRHGKPVDLEAENLLAICLQHEIDHLNGILYIDHISSLKRSLYKKKLKKMLGAKANGLRSAG